jgi:hypothetical protein
MRAKFSNYQIFKLKSYFCTLNITTEDVLELAGEGNDDH